MSGSPTVAFTVDLEPDCPPYLEGFRGVEHGLPALLRMLSDLEITATFFTTGDVARRFPSSVKEVVAAGHELGCHGMTHRAFTSLGPHEARYEIDRSVAILRRFGEVSSFRAPYLRFPSAYVSLLEDAAFTVDSSQARYKAAYYKTRPRTTLRRYPASVTSSALRVVRPLRSAYLRMLDERKPIVLFVHPWEFVDLRRERLRLDCRFRTGDVALACVADVLRDYRRRGARFVRMRELE